MRTPKPKKVSYELLLRDSEIGRPIYSLLDELVERHHDDLRGARLAIAWCTSWKADVDGRVTLGKCRKASDLDRELAQFDFVILLARWFWADPDVTNLQRKALLDHELCHAAVQHDARGEPVEDERGRLVFRTRKHDIEEFTDIVNRYGTYKRDLELFAVALQRTALDGFEPCVNCRDNPGWQSLTDARGMKSVRRCPCYLAWSQRMEALSA